VKFKRATIDIRFSRESGTSRDGRYAHGTTYVARYIETILPGQPLFLIRGGTPDHALLEIRDYVKDGEIDGELFFNGQYVYAFVVNGIVSNEYTTVRYYHDGFWFILEYRFLTRENS
jgi:hypothetical protein